MNRTLRVAIADDDPRLRVYFARLVELLGHEVVIQAENGEQLVAQCRKQPPDLIVTDMQMPVMTGLDAIDFLWRAQWIPAILVSGEPESQLLTARSSARRPQFLAKPIRIRDLNDSIERAMLRPSPPAAGGRPSPSAPSRQADPGAPARPVKSGSGGTGAAQSPAMKSNSGRPPDSASRTSRRSH